MVIIYLKNDFSVITADFIAMYTPGFSDMIRRSWFDTNHVTYRFAATKDM